MGGKTAQSEKIAGNQRNPKKKGGKTVVSKKRAGKTFFTRKWRESTCKHRFQQAWGYRSGEHDRKAFRFASMTASRLWPLLEQCSAACAVAPTCFACAKPTTASKAGWLLTAYH